MEKLIKEIKWSAPEYHYYEKSTSWYWLLVFLASLLLLFAIWQKNLFFAIFIIVAAAALMIWGKRPPQDIEFKITEKEISIDNKKSYAYENLVGFHLEENIGKFGDLILRSKSKFSPLIKIMILNKDIPEMKAFFKGKMEEIEYNESLSDALSRLIKF